MHGVDKTAGRPDAPQRNRGGNGSDPTPEVAAIHSDSWDGTVLCFGLCSTKLGTPVYPDCLFPDPVAMFISQSRTGWC
jgi:hypothetical protein